MAAHRFFACFALLAVCITSCTSLPPDVKAQVLLTPAMVVNECACGNAQALVDEQNSYGYFSPISTWVHSKCKIKPDVLSAVIDLGAEYQLTAIHFFDSFGTGKFEVSYGKPFHWDTLFSDPMNHFQYWSSKKINLKTRYIQLKSKDLIMPSEIILEGKKLGVLETAKPEVKTKYPLFGKFMGVNAFIDDPIGLLSPFGTVREYHPWFAWNQEKKGQIVFSPTEQGFNFDIFYSNLKNSDVVAIPVLQQSAKWLTGNENAEAKPVSSSTNTYNPASYKEHARLIYQYAARYGNSKVSEAKLILASNQERKSGLNTLQYFENWNEQDKWWKGKESYFSPYEYAAMSSADFDGHVGTMGKDVGIKNADQKAKLVIGGLADPNIDYIKALKFWCNHNRNGPFIWSAINIHYYCNDGGGQFQSFNGISPEEDKLREKLEAFTNYRNRFLPGVELWLSEFGYDVKDDSKQRVHPIGSMSAEQVQATWLVRSYLAASAAGFDKVHQYMIRDTEGSGTYASSGLYYWKKENGNKEAQLRPAWYYLATMQKVLGEYRFEKEIESSNENVKIYSFKADKKSNKIYVLWCGTSKDLKVENYNFSVEDENKNIWQVALTDKKSSGNISPLNKVDSKIQVSVSETPIFIVSSNENKFALPGEDHILPLSSAMISSQSIGNIEALTDEQSIVGDPDKGIFTDKPKTNWSLDYRQNFPIYATIDLGKEYFVTKLYVNDGPGHDNLTISVGKPGTWEAVDTDNLYNYNTWKAHVLRRKTRYLRLTKENANAGIFELAVYVNE